MFKKIRQIYALLKFVPIFLKEFLQANLSVAYVVLFKHPDRLRPQMIDYNTEDLTDAERLVMAQLITLTPGTITSVIDHQKKLLRIHFLDAPDPQKLTTRIDLKLKKPLLEVTR